MEQKYIPKDGRWIMENSGVFVDIEMDTLASDGSTAYVYINGKKYIGKVVYDDGVKSFKFEIDENIGFEIMESIVYLKIRDTGVMGVNYMFPIKFVSFPKDYPPSENTVFVPIRLYGGYLGNINCTIDFMFMTDKLKGVNDPS